MQVAAALAVIQGRKAQADQAVAAMAVITYQPHRKQELRIWAVVVVVALDTVAVKRLAPAAPAS